MNAPCNLTSHNVGTGENKSGAGYASQLPMAQKERMARWLAILGNRERKAAMDKAYREANKQKIHERRSRPENRAKSAARNRAERAKNPEKIRAQETAQNRKHGVLPRKEAWIKKVRPVLHSSAVREAAQKTAKSKGEQHNAARFWSLISPSGQVFRFRNLTAFIESNKHLFTPYQLEHVRPSKGRSIPRVVAALAMLSPRKKHPCGTMHGWRWHIDGKHHETLLCVLPTLTP